MNGSLAVMMKRLNFLLVLAMLCGPEWLMAQCKTFKLSDRGDTLNCVDTRNRKQGPWLVQVPEMRGNPGYEEEGSYVDDKKEGIWRRYTMEGDLVAVEAYHWGMLHGKSSYYSVLGLEREEGWWAINPNKLYDTIEVPDLYEDGKYTTVILKNEGRSLRHGTWRWFDPTTGFVQRTEEFIRDSAVSGLEAFGMSNSRTKKQPADTGKNGKKNEKPAVVQEYEKKNSGKKKVKVRDGSTGY